MRWAKFVKVTCVAACAAACTLTAAACHKGGGNAAQFGIFGYNGIYLTDYAERQINSAEAKQLIGDNLSLASSGVGPASARLLSDKQLPLPSEELIEYYINKYSACQITTNYYVEGNDDKQVKVDIIQGTDFRSALEENSFVPYAQLVTKYIVCFPELIDSMEEANDAFTESEQASVVPFNNIYSYHESGDGYLVIQLRDYSEISSSVSGGISASFRQDTEIMYDDDNKITKWQTSLGLIYSTPQGKTEQGYILEVEFEWQIKS